MAIFDAARAMLCNKSTSIARAHAATAWGVNLAAGAKERGAAWGKAGRLERFTVGICPPTAASRQPAVRGFGQRPVGLALVATLGRVENSGTYAW